MRIARSLRLVLFATAASAALCAPAYADEQGWGDVEVMADSEMEDLRGGFEVGGIEIGFGAVVTTILNGQPVLTTQLTITDAGRIVDQTMANVGQSLSDLTPGQRDALGLGGLDDASGIVIEDESGVTALVHNITEGALQNIIVNTATGRDISQDIDVTLTLPNFEFIQGEISLELFGMRLLDDMSGVAFGRGG
jgi:hypothetical protein